MHAIQTGATHRSRPGTAALISIIILCGSAVASYGQASLIDPSFAVGPGADNYVNAIALQSDGKIVVGGGFEFINDHSRAYLARLHNDGTFDSTFASGTDGSVSGLLTQPDGKILVSGSFTQLQGVPRIGLGRLLTNGVVDAEFDPGTLFETNGQTFRLAIQSDGKILIGTILENQNGRLFRLLPSGQLDESFVQTNIFEDYWIHGLLVRDDGKIFAGGGFNSVNGFSSPGLVLLNSSGEVDTNFSSGLKPLSDIFSILPLTNGGFLVAGILRNDSSTNVIARLTPSLAWDPNFNASPFEHYPPAFSYIRAALQQPDGKIVIGGNFYEIGGYWRRHVARLDAEGQVDPCFDPGVGLGYDFGANVVVRQPDGRIISGGTFYGSDGLGPSHIVRLLPQSDCNAIRVHLVKTENGYVAGTTFPGGTNYLQTSTNLVDWIDLDISTRSYVFATLDSIFDGPGPIRFFRVKKAY